MNGKVETRPGARISSGSLIEIDDQKEIFVSRSGYKLEYALNVFGIDVANKIAIDCGLSKGGFSQCLLRYGVSKIYGIDVGTGQVDASLAKDVRLKVMEKTNFRHVDFLPDPVDLFCLDLSFISLIKVIISVRRLANSGAEVVALVKPQFEVENKFVCSDGIVRDEGARKQACLKVIKAMQLYGFLHLGTVLSPIGDGVKSNMEYLTYFKAAF